jgi:cell wall-associated NlpC family hydrolase
MNKELMKQYALQFVGVPYHYGGSNPVGGIDCSGLVCEIFMAFGVFPFGTRLNAQMLHDRFMKDGSVGVRNLGALAFYGADETKIDHVGLFLDDTYIIEAAGGTATTITVQDAIAKNAFVKVRAYTYRKDFVRSILPTVMS